MAERLDDEFLEEFANQFFGYGNYRGSIWLVGMEEGGGNSIEDVGKKICLWVERGQRQLEDLRKYHLALGKTRLFVDRPKLQPTWNRLIHVLFGIRSHTPTKKQVREFQANNLGRADADHCLLELLPLPSPSTRRWLYSQHSRLEYLIDRKSYREFMIPLRTRHLRERILEHAPPVVLFYGLGYRRHWQEIAGVEFSETVESVYCGETHAILFVMTKHPASFGASNKYFYDVGRLIAKHL